MALWRNESVFGSRFVAIRRNGRSWLWGAARFSFPEILLRNRESLKFLHPSIHPSTYRSVSNPFHNSRFRDEHAHNRDSSDKIRRSGRGDCLSSRREYCALDCSLSAVIISKSWYQGKYRNASWRECSAYRRYSEMAVDVSAMASHGPRDRPPIAIIDKNGGRTIRPPDISPIFLSLASFNVQFDLIDKLNISNNNFKWQNNYIYILYRYLNKSFKSVLKKNIQHI